MIPSLNIGAALRFGSSGRAQHPTESPARIFAGIAESRKSVEPEPSEIMEVLGQPSPGAVRTTSEQGIRELMGPAERKQSPFPNFQPLAPICYKLPVEKKTVLIPPKIRKRPWKPVEIDPGTGDRGELRIHPRVEFRWN